MEDQEQVISTEVSKGDLATTANRRPYRLRLPGFVRDEDIGLGEAIRRVTYAVGVRPTADCGCKSRAAMLNQWIVFTGRR